MPLGQTIPALPVRDVTAAVSRYVGSFGFETVVADRGFAVLRRDQAVLHLWLAGDESWVPRADLASRPVRSGAESFLAGTASCRIEVGTVAELESLYAEYLESGILHQVSAGEITTTDFGTREFYTLDLDGNLVSFFVWR